MARLTTVEQLIDHGARSLLRRLPRSGLSDSAVEFLVFALKQGWACLFGGLFLALVLVTAGHWPPSSWVTRYDFLFCAALGIQAAMLALKLEKPEEALVILAFHAVGTVMEVFKTAHGSWTYPGPSFLHLAQVPLFSGFMYGAVGSYIARATRIFDFQFVSYPPTWATVTLAAAIYCNFFAHHYVWDARYLLLVATSAIFWRCHIHYRVFRFRHRMPLLLGFGLVALFIWAAENISTWSRIWLYPQQQHGWTLVPLEKFGSWYLLMIISFVLVNLVHRPKRITENYPSQLSPASQS